MKLIRPTQITDAILVSSNIPENDYGDWDAGYTYGLDQRVIHGHRIWRSAQAGNIARDPLTSAAGWWIDIGPTNRWAMFDGVVGTSSSADRQITIKLAAGRVDSILLMQVDAAQAVIVQRVGSEIVSQRTIILNDDSSIASWYDYFFTPIKHKDSIAITDMTVYGESMLEITLSKNTGTVSCGVCIVGLKDELGMTLVSPKLGINDYSRKTTDDFGRTSLVKRDFSKRMGLRVMIDNRDIDRVFTTLAATRATPVVWIGDARISAMLIYGFFRDFDIDVAYATVSYCTINIEGMI